MSAVFSTPDRSNIQGLILRGYTHPCSCHLLFTFTGGANTLNTKSFFNDLYDKVQSAADWGNNKPVSMLNIGLTYNGLGLLNIMDAASLARFPDAFKNGPWSGASQQSLADVFDPKSVPSNWWNGNGTTVNTNLHCVVHVYGLTSTDLDALVTFVTNSATANGLVEILPLDPKNTGGRLYQAIVYNDPAKIHFGYTDGISEPALGAPGNTGLTNQEDYSNFLIGYYNGSISQPGPFDTGADGAFAKNGCYNAFRVVYQDVASFNSFLQQQVTAWRNKSPFIGKTDQEIEEWFAAKLCGRWRNGSPMILSPDKPGEDDTTAATGENFGYSEMDNPALGLPSPTNAAGDVLSGGKCPFSAHTRVANPRNQTLTAAEGTNGPPRILRRGVPYGPTLQSATDDGLDRGLVGLFLCGSLTGQFELLYGWMNYNNFTAKPVFSVMKPPQDALLGNRALVAYQNNYPGVVTSFNIPAADAPGGVITIKQLPQWLTTRGTAYCLLPSLASLKQIAGRE